MKTQIKKKKKNSLANAFFEAKCPVCGNKFIPAVQHVYKDKRAPYKKVCSWHCVCESQRLKDATAQRKTRKG